MGDGRKKEVASGKEGMKCAKRALLKKPPYLDPYMSTL